MPAASLSSRTDSTATSGAVPDERVERGRQRGDPGRVVRAVEDRERRRRPPPPSGPAWHRIRRRAHRRGVERAGVGLRRGHRDREVLALEGPARAQLHVVAGGRSRRPSTQQPRRRARPPPAPRLAGLGAERAGDQRAGGGHDRQLLLGDVALRRAQPARVLEAHVREHLYVGPDHARGVVAASEPGLDDGHRDPGTGQLPVGGGGQRLELGHAVAGLERAIDLRGRLGGAGDRLCKALVGHRAATDLDPLGPRDEMRGQVGAGPHTGLLEQRSDHPRRRGLAVRPHDVDRPEALLGRAERRHQAPHALEAEPHAEHLERVQVALRLAQRGRCFGQAHLLTLPARPARTRSARASRARPAPAPAAPCP